MIIVLVFLYTSLFNIEAQNIFFSSEKVEYAPWDEEAQDFVDFVLLDDNEISIFELFEDLSKLTQKINDINSIYEINADNYDEETLVYEFFTTSEAGNNYVFTLDLNSQILQSIGMHDNGSFYMLVYHIKEFWTEE